MFGHFRFSHMSGILWGCGTAYARAKLIQAMQVGILHGKVEPDHSERNPAQQEANSGRRGVADCVSVPEELYEGNPHVRYREGEQVV